MGQQSFGEIAVGQLRTLASLAAVVLRDLTRFSDLGRIVSVSNPVTGSVHVSILLRSLLNYPVKNRTGQYG